MTQIREAVGTAAEARSSAMSKRKQKKPAEMKVMYSDSLHRTRVKLASALLNWRYGINQRSFELDDTDIIVVGTESEFQAYSVSDKLVLPGFDLLMLREIADEHIKPTGNKPTILVPPGDDWLISQFKRSHYNVNDCSELLEKIRRFNGAFNFEQQAAIRSEIRRLLIDMLDGVDYIAVSERCGAVHVVIASVGAVLGKPVFAEAVSPVVSAIADFFVPRREDLVALVDAMTTIGLGG